MINKIILRKYLGYFRPQQVNRGKQLYFEGAVIHIDTEKEKKIITAKVEGGHLYTVQLKYLSDNQIASGTCTCPYRSFCKHQAALIHYLIHDIQFSSGSLFQMEGNTGEFRLLPSNDLNEIRDLLWQRSNAFTWRMSSFSFELVNRETIHCYKLSDRYPYEDVDMDKQEENPQVEIDLSQEYPAVKCNACNQNITGLCSHTAKALQGLLSLDAFGKYYYDIDQYNGIIANFCERWGVSESILINHFRLFIRKSNYELVKNDDRIMIGEEWDKFVSSIEEIMDFSSATNSLFLMKKQDEYELNLGDAMVWSEEWERGRYFYPIIIEGKLNRDQTKLSSHIRETGNLQYSTSVQKDFYYEYEKLISRVQSHDIRSIMARILGYLKDHFEVFSSFLHYFHQPSDECQYYRKDKLKKKDLSLFSFSEEKANLCFEVRDVDEFYEMKIAVKVGQQLISQKDVTYYHNLFLLIGNKAYLYENPDVFSFISSNKDREMLHFAKSKAGELKIMLFRLSEQFQINALPESLTIDRAPLSNGNKKLLIRESGRILTFEPLLHYEDFDDINVLSPYPPTPEGENGEIGVIPDEEEVKEFIEFMDGSHPSFEESRQGYEYYYISIEDALKDSWFLEFFAECRSKGIAILGEDLLKNFKFNRHRGVVSTAVTSGIDWFDLQVNMSFGNQTVSPKKWVEALRNGEKYIQLDDGSLGILPEEWLARLQKVAKIFDVRGQKLRISKLSFNVVEEIFEELGEDELVEQIRVKKEKLRSFESMKTHPIPRTVKARLRDYQKKGFQWLKFLDEFQFGGCLADDMGLGKTLQVLSFLADQKKLKKGTSLVVVPRSLLFNWAAEIDKYCPSLKYEIYHGTDRKFETKEIARFDLIISTYDTVTIDIEKIREFEFNYCILDESQAIKNPHSKRYKAMRLLNASNRLVMTGTPIENNTFDLYGQFNYINPGLLGGITTFKKKFAVPIDKQNNAEAADHLRKLIYPFLLRRTKEQVASDLPEKTESLLRCEMGTHQRKLYDELKETIRSDLERTIDAEGMNKSRFKILEGLLRLRQMCNSPLLLSSHPGNKKNHSAKLEMFLEHLEEVILTHKALVFSQFVSMLKLIRTELEKKKITYAYLDGSTTDRQASVDKFQNEANCKVFLISLKAGNTGLNLTDAEYVYIFDPWWNPAAEAQAIDRTHRIGQSNNVFAYKLICQDTIEEKILKLQERKKKVASDIIRTDEHILKSLNKEKIMALLD